MLEADFNKRLSTPAHGIFVTAAAGVEPTNPKNVTAWMSTRLAKNNRPRAVQQRLHLKLLRKMWEHRNIVASIIMAFDFDNALTGAKDVNMHTHILCVMNGEPAQIESFLKAMETYGIEKCGMDARPKMGGTSNGRYFGFWYEIVSTIRKIRNSTVAYFTVPPMLCHYTKLPREGYQPGWRYVQYYLKLIYMWKYAFTTVVLSGF